MDTWGWWLVAACVLAAGEMLTLDLTLAMLAAGALAGGGVALIDAGPGPDLGFPVQAAAALAVAVTGLWLLRPVALRHVRRAPELRTGVARLVGADAVVLERVGPGGGRVKLDGEVWSARSYDGFSTFESGEGVSVLQIEGATALVG